MSQSNKDRVDKPQVLRETDDAARAQARGFVRDSAHGALATLEPSTLWPLHAAQAVLCWPNTPR